MCDVMIKQLEVADIMSILDALPHRYPFLLVDRIIDIQGSVSCIGIKNVTINEPYFGGHFPKYPVMPGVLIIEGMAQTAGAMCILDANQGDKNDKIYFLGIDKARFRKPVVPGDVLHYHVKTLHRRKNVCRFFSEGRVNDILVAEAEFSAMIGK